MTTEADAEDRVSSPAADSLGATFELEWNGIVARDPVSGAEISFGELVDLMPTRGPSPREE